MFNGRWYKIHSIILTSKGASIGKRRDTIGEAWALALSPDGKVLNTTTHDGRVILWDSSSLKKMVEINTKGSFGTSVACVLPWLL